MQIQTNQGKQEYKVLFSTFKNIQIAAGIPLDEVINSIPKGDIVLQEIICKEGFKTGTEGKVKEEEINDWIENTPGLLLTCMVEFFSQYQVFYGLTIKQEAEKKPKAEAQK